MDEERLNSLQPDVAAPAPGGNVMDVQPPAKQEPRQSVSTPAALAEQPPEVTPQMDLPDTSAPSATPVQSPISDELPSTNDSEVSEEPMQPLLAAKPETHKKSKSNTKPKLVIFVAIVVAALMIGLTVFAYQASQNENEIIDHSTHTPETNSQPVTIDELNQTDEEVEKAVNQIDDDVDFSEDELSNKKLELGF